MSDEVDSKFIYVATDAVFGGSGKHYRESDALDPFALYWETNLAGEEAVLSETDALVVRTNFVGWSPPGDTSILEFFLQELL